MPAHSPVPEAANPSRLALRRPAALLSVALVILAAVLSCSLPSVARKTATPANTAAPAQAATQKSLPTALPQPTPTSRDFPPQLLDSQLAALEEPQSHARYEVLVTATKLRWLGMAPIQTTSM